MLVDVAVGSIVSILAYPRHVRFAPNSDRVADVPDVSFVPTTDSCGAANGVLFDHLVGGKQKSFNGTVRAKRLGVFVLITSSNLVGCFWILALRRHVLLLDHRWRLEAHVCDAQRVSPSAGPVR